MSKKDVEEYYNLITNDYKDMVNTLKEMEDLAAQDIVNPDKVDDIKQMIEPLKNNYQRISYIMFLLNKPQRKSKAEKYKQQNKKYLASIKDVKTEHEENCEIIKATKEAWANTGEEE